MATHMKDNGRITSVMEKESRSGQMAVRTQENTKTAKNVARESLVGQTKVLMWANFKIITFTVKENFTAMIT